MTASSTTNTGPARLTDRELDELTDLGSATVFEAAKLPCDLDPAFRPAWAGARVVGHALPVQVGLGDNLGLHIALLQAQPGDVLVVDAGAGRFGYWGEVLAVAAQHRGVRGLIIDGGVRDTERLRELGFPTFSTSIAIRGTGKDWIGTVGEIITLRGRPIRRHDVVVGDEDGIAVLPSAEYQSIVAAARDRTAAEAAYLARLRGGETTLDVYQFPAAKLAGYPGANNQSSQQDT